MKKSLQGFTLIELMITVAIVAILAAIAYPNYTRYITRTNRAEGRNALLQLQVAQEKFFLQNNRYAGGTTAAASVAELNNAPTLPTASTPGLGIPTSTSKGYYTITLVTSTPVAYIGTATATGSQAADTACATLTIDQTGARTPTTGDCWK